MAALVAACLAPGGAPAGGVDGAPLAASNAPSLLLPPGSAAVATHESAARSNLIWGLRWDDGLQYELGGVRRMARLMALHPDADVQPYHGKVGLKLQGDAVGYRTDGSLDDISDDVGIRRARLYTSGAFFLKVPISYKAEAEIADRDFYLRELYLWLSEIPLLQTVKFGHFKAPMTLEAQTSAGDTLFMERASPVEAFGPGILFGIQASRTSADKRKTGAIGWFADSGQNDVSEASRSLSRAIGRATWLPLWEEDAGAEALIHVGASGQFMQSGGRDLQFRSRPESYFAPRLVDTGEVTAEDALTWGAEFAAQRRSLLLQAEFLDALASRSDQPDLAFNGWYVAGSWLMTGERRPYNRNAGAFGHVVPRRNLAFRAGALGAWELVARFSWLDLESHDVEGGRMHVTTLGVNGYLTSRCRVMLDCAAGRVSGGEQEGDVRIVESRVQYEF